MFITENVGPIFYGNLWGGTTAYSCRNTSGVDARGRGQLKIIGIFGLAQIPYTLKFLWAPLIDRFSIPFFDRRRGWP